MSVDLSKINYGVIVGPEPGIRLSKINYGVIVDTTTPTPTPSGRRRAMPVVNYRR